MKHSYYWLLVSAFLMSPIAAMASSLDTSEIAEKEVQFAKQFIEDVRLGNLETARAAMDPEFAESATDENLKSMAAYFPAGKLLNSNMIGSHVSLYPSRRIARYSFEYEFESGWAIASLATKHEDGVTTVLGVNLKQTSASQGELNRFSLSGKSITHYAVLFLVCAMPVFIVYTMIMCIRTPIPKRKWLWIIFILLGIGSVSINWTTGAFTFNVLHIQLLGASALAASDHAPWILTASIPLGAILFWSRRKSYINASKAL